EGLQDLSEQAEEAYRTTLEEFAGRAAAMTATGADRVTLDVLISQASGYLDRLSTRMTEFTISDLFVAPAVGLLTVLPMVGVRGEEQGRTHLTRLAAIPRFLQQAADRHRAGVAAGRVPVAHLVRAAIAHLDRYLAD